MPAMTLCVAMLVVTNELTSSFLQSRHRSDREVNNRETRTVVGKEFVTRKWKDIKVGDMVQLTNNEFVTVSFSNVESFFVHLLFYLPGGHCANIDQ